MCRSHQDSEDDITIGEIRRPVSAFIDHNHYDRIAKAFTIAMKASQATQLIAIVESLFKICLAL